MGIDRDDDALSGSGVEDDRKRNDEARAHRGHDGRRAARHAEPIITTRARVARIADADGSE